MSDPREAHQKPPFEEKPQEHPGHTSRMEEKPDHGEQSYVGKGRLEGKVAIITGGDSGIGRAVAIAFAREGADVLINSLEAEEQDARETQRWVEQAGRRAVLLSGDLAKRDVPAQVIKEAVNAFGRVDILVNNAAFQGKSVERLEEISADRIRRSFDVNIIAMFELVKAALPHMKEGGAIINTASIQAYQPSAGILDYAATKGAIVTFTKGLAQELVSRGIRVNSVAPGPVWTPLIVQSFSDDKVKSFGGNSPMGRPAQPVELAPSFVFLASDDARYINGEILGVTGGKVLA